MSYDFRLFLPQPGVDPLITAHDQSDEDADEINPGPPIPQKEARKRALASALMKSFPALEIFKFGFEEIATFENISVNDAKERFRHIELNGPEDGPGIQITLFDDGASLTVPYWHKGNVAKTVFREIWEYLKLIQDTAGYQIYDPQRDCLTDLGSDLEKTTTCYTKVVGTIY